VGTVSRGKYLHRNVEGIYALTPPFSTFLLCLKVSPSSALLIKTAWSSPIYLAVHLVMKDLALVCFQDD
jgi:hypothetical protein